jgi:hypothetical protein
MLDYDNRTPTCSVAEALTKSPNDLQNWQGLTYLEHKMLFYLIRYS